MELEDADGRYDGNDVEDADDHTDDNTDSAGEPNPKSADPRQGLAGTSKRQLFEPPSSFSSDEGFTDIEPNSPQHKRAKYALPTSVCGCAKVCKDIVKTLAQDRKFMGIDLGLEVLNAAYKATGKSFEGFCFAHLRLLVSTATGMRNSYYGSDFDHIRSCLTTYLKHSNNIPMLRKKRYDWFCTELQNNSIRSS